MSPRTPNPEPGAEVQTPARSASNVILDESAMRWWRNQTVKRTVSWQEGYRAGFGGGVRWGIFIGLMWGTAAAALVSCVVGWAVLS